VGSRTTSYLYLGDRWKSKNLADSRYIWLPLTIKGGMMSIPPDRPWTVDAATGEIATGNP